MSLIIKKIFSLSTLALIVALLLSGIAAWYSVVGLTAIFAAAVIPIIIMGGALEVAKVVTTVWLHRYWDRCKWLMKTYLTIAVLVLALVTSMGIFGFLSKAHLDQGVPTGDVAAQIQLIDEKINIQRELISSERQNIEAARNTLSQMDAQLTARLDRGDSEASVERAVQIRAQQRRERNTLNNEITNAQKRIEVINQEIQKLNLEKAPLAASYRKIEAEVGPIKYIAALIYGDNPDQNTLERAVRWVIILLIFVFDPLALILVLAAISSYKWEFEKKEEYKPLPPIAFNTSYPPLVPVIEPVTEVKVEETLVKKKFQENQNQESQSTEKYQKSEQTEQDQNQNQKTINKLKSLLKLNINQQKNLQKRLKTFLQSQLLNNLRKENLTDWSKSPVLNLLKKLKKTVL